MKNKTTVYHQEYQRLLQQFSHFKEYQQGIEKTIEEQDWQQAQQTQTKIAYQQFLEQYPDSRYQTQANQLIAEINKQQQIARQKIKASLLAPIYTLSSFFNTLLKKISQIPPAIKKVLIILLIGVFSLWGVNTYFDYQEQKQIEAKIEVQRKAEEIEKDLDNIIAWVDKYHISKGEIPRDKEKLRKLTKLYLSGIFKDSKKGKAYFLESLKSLYSVQEVIISYNNLTKLPDFIFKLNKLTFLNIHGNSIENLKISLSKLQKITGLGLDNNQFIQLSNYIKKSENIISLDLAINGYKKLPESIGNLTQLRELNIAANRLTELPESIGKLTQLKKLRIDYNQLTELPESIGKLTQLKKLRIRYNQLTKLPESIGKLTQLKELWISKNQLTKLPESISKLTQLKELSIYFNQLTKLPESIGNLTQLERFYIKGNPLTKLPKSINKLINLNKYSKEEIEAIREQIKRNNHAND